MRRVEPPEDFDSHSLSEFAEAFLFASSDDFLSVAELRGLFVSGSKPTDLQLEEALIEIERRSRDFGALYPFDVNGRGIRITRKEENALYECLLLLSLRGTPLRASGQYGRSDLIFDEIVRIAFRNHAGQGANSVVFGWPPRGDRPNIFSLAVAWVADCIGVGVKNPKIPDIYKDAGVDIISWKSFADGRSSFPVTLIQNTVQFDFRQKPRDVLPSQWRGWLEISADPRVGFAVPFSLPREDPWWEHASTDVDTMMDRGRLMSQLQEEHLKAWPTWSEFVEFVAEESASDPSADTEATIVRPRKRARSALYEQGMRKV